MTVSLLPERPFVNLCRITAMPCTGLKTKNYQSKDRRGVSSKQRKVPRSRDCATLLETIAPVEHEQTAGEVADQPRGATH
jgi:hypothetical protein